MHALAALSGPYLPWGSGAMRPAGLVTVCNDIVLNERRRIVELGSGISTVLLARLLTQRPPPGGFLMASVEHDPVWARWVRDQLDREGIGTDVTIVQAPLVPHARAEPGLAWYDEAALAQGLREALRGPIRSTCCWWTARPLMPPATAWPATPPCRFSQTSLPRAPPSFSTTPIVPGSRRYCAGGSTRRGLTFDRSPERGGVAVARMAAEGTGPSHG